MVTDTGVKSLNTAVLLRNREGWVLLRKLLDSLENGRRNFLKYGVTQESEVGVQASLNKIKL